MRTVDWSRTNPHADGRRRNAVGKATAVTAQGHHCRCLPCVSTGGDVVKLSTMASHFFLGIGRNALNFLSTTLHVLPEPTHRVAADQRNAEYEYPRPLDQ